MHRRTRPAMAALALALAVAGCSASATDDAGSDAASPAASALLPADQAATVNGDPIDNDLYAQLVEAARASTEQAQAEAGEPVSDEQLAEQRRSVLSSLILSELVTQFAADQGIELTDADVQEVVDEGGDELAQAAEQSGLSSQQYARLFPAQDVLINRVVDQALADLEVTQAMVDQQTTATLSHILVETQEEAEQALSRIESGADFAEVARDVSVDGSAAQGGQLGQDVALSNFTPAFAEAAAEAPVGEVVGPVATEFGFHLILVEERTEVTADDLTDQQRREALASSPAGQEAIAPLSQEFDTALSSGEVVVSSRYGVWDPATRSVVTEEAIGQGGTAPPPAQAPPADAPPATPTPESTPTG